MKKNTYYFSHEYTARSDPKIKNLLSKHGILGIGVYWCIIEDLYINTNVLPLNYDSIAYDLRVDSFVIESVINDFDLFQINEGVISSNSVQRRLDERKEKSLKASESVSKRWKKSDGNTNVFPSNIDSNTNKGKEKKEKEKEKRDINISKKARDVSFDARFVELPFSSERFQTAWNNWCSHKEEIKNTITPTAAKQQLSKLASAGESDAIKMIEKSISSQWKGLFNLDDSELSKQVAKHDPANPSKIPAGYQKPKLVL